MYKNYQNIADTLVFAIIFEIHSNYFFVLPIRLKFADLMFSLFLNWGEAFPLNGFALDHIGRAIYPGQDIEYPVEDNDFSGPICSGRCRRSP